VQALMPCVSWALCRGRKVCHVPPWTTVVANCLPCVRVVFPRGQQVCRVPSWAGTRQRLCVPCSGPAWHTADLLATAAACFLVVFDPYYLLIDLMYLDTMY
jgi:hypothetical protein